MVNLLSSSVTVVQTNSSDQVDKKERAAGNPAIYRSIEEAIAGWNKGDPKRPMSMRYGFDLYNPGCSETYMFTYSPDKGWAIVSRTTSKVQYVAQAVFNFKSQQPQQPTRLADLMPEIMKTPIKDSHLTTHLIKAWNFENKEIPCPLYEVAFSDIVTFWIGSQKMISNPSPEALKTIRDTITQSEAAIKLNEGSSLAKVIRVTDRILPFLNSFYELREPAHRIKGFVEASTCCLVFTDPLVATTRFLTHMKLQYGDGSRNWTNGHQAAQSEHMTGLGTKSVETLVETGFFNQKGVLMGYNTISQAGAILFDDKTKDIVIDEFNKWAATQTFILVHHTALGHIFTGQEPVVDIISQYASL